MRLAQNNRSILALAGNQGGTLGQCGSLRTVATQNDRDQWPSSQQCSVQAFTQMLETCRKSRNRDQALHLFSCMPPFITMDHTTIANQLVALLVEVGSLHHARHVFDRLLHRDVSTWSSLITGYVRHGEWKNALTFYQIMQKDTSMLPSDYTFVSLLKACIGLKDMERGSELHTLIASRGLLKANIYVGSALVDMYVKCGSLSKAQEVFNEIPQRDVVLWTTLIAGYVEYGRAEEALQCIEQMKSEGFSQNAHTLVCSSKACGRLKATNRGQEIHTEITMKGFESEVMIGNSLLCMYAACGLVETAKMLLDKLPVRDVVSWTSMIDGYAEHGYGKEALSCLDCMYHENISPNALTFVCSVKACWSIGAIEKGHKLHSAIIERGFESELRIGSVLVSMYVKCSALTEAQFVFDKLPVRDSILWTALIEGYSHVGESRSVFLNFDKMLKECIKPELATFVMLLNACNYEGLLENFLTYFETIRNDYGVILTLEHYTTMVDLFGRSGHLSKAVSMIEEMPFHPDYVLWCTMLRACRNEGNLKVARYAFENAIKLNDKSMILYVCMSNIYVDAAMHNEANKVEQLGVQNEAWEKLEVEVFE